MNNIFKSQNKSIENFGETTSCTNNSSCGNATHIRIPDGITTIENNAFKDNKHIISVVIPDSVTSIGESAFNGCSSLESVVIPNSVTRINGYAFAFCTSLTEVVIPDSVESIDIFAFGDCNNLASVKIGNKVTRIGPGAFGDCNSLVSVVLPDSVKSIEHTAFAGCTSLESIVIPDSVKSIGKTAFRGCTSLPSVIIPDSVTRIGDQAFYGCSSLRSVTFKSNDTANLEFNSNYANPDGKDAKGVFYDTPVKLLFTTNITDPAIQYDPVSFTTTIDRNEEVVVVKENTIVQVTLRNGTTLQLENPSNLSLTAFTDKDNSITSETLQSWQVNKDIDGFYTSIGSRAFLGCSSLASVVIPDSVTSIGDKAFYGCSSLDSVIIPNGVTRILTSTFDRCTSLDSVVIPDSVESIGEQAFHACSSLVSVVIPDSVKIIELYAFAHCSSLAEVVIPDSLESIDEGTFQSCSSLNNVVIPDSVRSIGIYAFFECSSLNNVVIPDSVSISAEAFANCGCDEKIYRPGVTMCNCHYVEDSTCFEKLSTTTARTARTTTSQVLIKKIEINLDTNVDVQTIDEETKEDLEAAIRSEIERDGVTVKSIRLEFIENMGDTDSKIKVIVEIEVSNENIAEEIIDDIGALADNSNSGIVVDEITFPVISVSRETVTPPVPTTTSGNDDDGSNVDLIIGIIVGLLLLLIVPILLQIYGIINVSFLEKIIEFFKTSGKKKE